MKYFLVIYNRPRTEIITLQEFGDYRSAATERRARELEYRSRPDIEVVVLGAENKSAIEKTHSRYFKNERELADLLCRTIATVGT